MNNKEKISQKTNNYGICNTNSIGNPNNTQATQQQWWRRKGSKRGNAKDRDKGNSIISIRRSLPSLPADHMISLSHSACHNSRKLIMQCRLTSLQCCNRYGRWLISCGGLRTVSLRIRPNVYYFRLLFWRNVPQVLSGVFFFCVLFLFSW